MFSVRRLSRALINNRPLPLLVLLLVSISAACQTQPSTSTTTSTPDTHATDEAALKSSDEEWSKTAGTKDVDKTVAFYSSDATVLPPNAPAITGKEPIRALWKELLGGSGSISWKVSKIDIAKSGELGYVTGTYEITGSMAEKGKYLEVWKKQSNGSWKCAVDMFSSNAPSAPAPTKATTEKSK